MRGQTADGCDDRANVARSEAQGRRDGREGKVERRVRSEERGEREKVVQSFGCFRMSILCGELMVLLRGLGCC